MKEKTCKNVRFYYGWIFSAFTVVVGALFIWQVLSLYFTGTAEGFSEAHVFSRGRVLDALSKIRLFFWLWVAGVVAGFVLWEVFPLATKPSKVCPDLQYARLVKRLPASSSEQIKQKQLLILALRYAAWALFGVACVYGVVYLCIPKHFPHEDVMSEVLNFVKNVFPCIFAGLLVICGASAYEKFAVKAMLPEVKKLTAGQKEPVQKTGLDAVLYKIDCVFDNKWVILGIRIALAAIGVAFIIWGALNGNAHNVLVKAINICTECIGLG